MSGECKEGNHREDDEGGISVEDLQRGDISEIQSREERERRRGGIIQMKVVMMRLMGTGRKD